MPLCTKKGFTLRYGTLPFCRLTAFVMRVFCKAQQFAGVNIDENVVCQSVGWLIANQRGDGSLPEVHAVIHKEMVVRYATQILSSNAKVCIVLYCIV